MENYLQDAEHKSLKGKEYNHTREPHQVDPHA